MNRRAFGERVTAMQGSLYRVAASYLHGESDRLDAVAEVIAKAWEKRQTLRDEALFATWMTRILIRGLRGYSAQTKAADSDRRRGGKTGGG